MINEQLDGQLRMATLDPLEGKQFQVRKRDGRVIDFDETRIYLAIEAALKADVELADDVQASEEMQADAQRLTNEVVERSLSRVVEGEALEIERIQDTVEDKLMELGFRGAARRYIVYREERRKARAIRGDRTVDGQAQELMFVTLPDGGKEVLDSNRLKRDIYSACRGVEDKCQANDLFDETMRNLYDGVQTAEIDKAMIMSAKARIEKEPAYTYVAARLLLNQIYEEVLPKYDSHLDLPQVHRDHFREYLQQGVAAERLSPELLKFDLDKLAATFDLARDHQFVYMGIQTIYDRYLIHIGGTRIETPQYFYMRVSMGRAGNEANKEERAIEFYNTLSSFRFMSSTPTLFNAGTLHPQLSSCYLSTVDDDLESIFKLVAE